MSAIALYLKCRRLDTDAEYVTSSAGDITVCQIDRTVDQPAMVHLEINLLSALAIALVNATGGPSMTAAIIPLHCELSLDGGASIDFRFVLVSAQRSMDPRKPVLTIDQADQSVLYSVSGTDRVTYINADPQQVLNGYPGTIQRPAGAIGRGLRPTWPEKKGLYQTTPGPNAWAGQHRLKMTPHLAPILTFENISMDINADTITNSTKALGTRQAGKYNPGDTAPQGTRGHVVPYTGDAGRNPVGIAQCISIGGVDYAPRVTFDGDTAGTWDETTTIRFSGQGLALDPMLAELYSQTSMIGGSSTHGLSSGASGGLATTLTDMVVINTTRGPASTQWDDNLPIIATSAGVFYHIVGSGFLVPMSPVWNVSAISYDPASQTLVVGTETGAFLAFASPPPFPGGPGTWTRVGGINFPIADLWLDSAGVIFARVGGNASYNGASLDGVYCYPALSGDTSGDRQGYAGWSRIAHSASILAAGGTSTDLYYTDANKPDTVYHIKPGTTTKPIPSTVAAGQAIVGIDTVLNVPVWQLTGQYVFHDIVRDPASSDVYISVQDGNTGHNPATSPSWWTKQAQGDQYIYVRTDAGNAGLYSCQVGTDGLINANSDNSLLAGDGTQVQIRKVRPAGIIVFGEYISVWCVTDGGLFRTGRGGGNGWSAPNAESGLGDFDVSMVAAGTVQTVLGQQIHRIFMGAANNLFISCDAGDNWRDLLSDRLDTGAAWYARALAWNGGQWPDNTIGALGDDAGVVGGGSGTTLKAPANAKGTIKRGYTRERRLDEQKQFTFRLVNRLSQAPQAGIQWHELSELQSDANTGVVTASEQVELVEWRYLSAASTPRFQLPLSGAFTQTNAIARDLAPGAMARVLYNPAGWTAVLALDIHLYVISHSIIISGGTARTKTLLSNTMEAGNLDPNAMAAAEADRMTKRLRYGHA